MISKTVNILKTNNINDIDKKSLQERERNY